MEKWHERLIDLLDRHCALRQENNDCTNETTEDCSTCLADFLLANGVVVLPCKVGNTVWSIADCGKEPLEFKVHEIIITKDRTIICLKGRRYRTIVSEAFGKTIFFTKEEAEAVLEEQRK